MKRREIIKLLSAGMTLPSLASMGCQKPKSSIKGGEPRLGLQLTSGQDRKFLFVFTAMGGASINDSFMAVRHSENSKPSEFNTFADSQVFEAEGTNLRAVDLSMDSVGPLPFEVKSNQSRFLSKYAKDIMVATIEGTTVAHPVGQERSVNGNNAWNGRTLQEAVAAQYGSDLLLPNVNMATVGYANYGTDTSLPSFARAEQVASPTFFPFSTHGYKGIQGAPKEGLIKLARDHRNSNIEIASPFYNSFQNSSLVKQWIKARSKQAKIEERDLINKLNAFEDTEDFPFSEFGLSPNEGASQFREIFPDLGADPLQTQALLAYLLVTSKVSCTVTFGLGMNVTVDGSDEDDPKLTNTPTGFDYSHNAHRGTQALLWQRTLDTIDRLITLLKATEYKDGSSYWDHSMVYIATEFGRDKTREGGLEEFPSGHHTNNGSVIISPLANGGKVLGGIDPDSLMTYGFDPKTGKPDPGRKMSDREIYSGILGAMSVDTSGSGLPDIPAMKRKG